MVETAGSVGGALAIGGRRRARQDDELAGAGKRSWQTVATAEEKSQKNKDDIAHLFF